MISGPSSGASQPGKRPVTWISRADAFAEETLRAGLQLARTVLDVGPGIRPQTLLSPDVHICVEPYEPYVARLRNELADDSRFLFLNAGWDRVLPIFADQSIDSVVALDVIEHLERRDGQRLVAEALRIARSKSWCSHRSVSIDSSTRAVTLDPLGNGWHASGANASIGLGFPTTSPLDRHIVACADFQIRGRSMTQQLATPFGALLGNPVPGGGQKAS